QLGAGPVQGSPERTRIQHAEQQVDVGADEAMPVVLDRTDVGGRPKLDARGVTGDVVMSPDEAAQPLRQRIDEALAGHDRRYHDQGTVAAVFAEAVRPRDAGAVESLVQDLVELLAKVESNVIVAVRASEPGDVHREQGTHLPVSRRGGRLGRWAAHGRPAPGTTPLALAIRSSAQKLIRSSLSDRGEMPTGKVRPVASVQF